MDTGILGGVADLTEADLKAMQQGQYILHARRGELEKVPADKVLLPRDPQGHPQAVNVATGPDGAIYVNQRTILCKSVDGGQTWSAWPRQADIGAIQILSNGTLISGSGGDQAPIVFWASRDGGHVWEKVSAIELPRAYHTWGLYGLFRLPDDSLLASVQCSSAKFNGLDWASGTVQLFAYHSDDLGKTWGSPSKVCDWGSEGGIARTASGRLLAVVRHQRPVLPTDPPGLIEITARHFKEATGKLPPRVYKHVFLADSEDNGRTWKNFRQLTTVFGQCYGFPAALADGTVAVAHDTRYGPGVPSGRAMISRDEGRTWQDEVYYLYYGEGGSGYNQSVVLNGRTILTIAGTTDYLPARQTWEAAIGRCDITAIRWHPAAS